jgi:hypothetical protein
VGGGKTCAKGTEASVLKYLEFFQPLLLLFVQFIHNLHCSMIHEGKYLDCPMTGAWETNARVIDHEGRVYEYDAPYLAGMCEAFEAFMVK